jgi:hypothetical protein
MVNLNAGGRWNTFDITARGTKLIVIINGMKTVDVDHKGHARGPLAGRRRAAGQLSSTGRA